MVLKLKMGRESFKFLIQQCKREDSPNSQLQHYCNFFKSFVKETFSSIQSMVVKYIRKWCLPVHEHQNTYSIALVR